MQKTVYKLDLWQFFPQNGNLANIYKYDLPVLNIIEVTLTTEFTWTFFDFASLCLCQIS